MRPDDAMKFGHRVVACTETDGGTATLEPAMRETVRRLDESMSEQQPLWHEPIELPNGITQTVAGVVEGLHLQCFVEVELDRVNTALDDEDEDES